MMEIMIEYWRLKPEKGLKIDCVTDILVVKSKKINVRKIENVPKPEYEKLRNLSNTSLTALAADAPKAVQNSTTFISSPDKIITSLD